MCFIQNLAMGTQTSPHFVLVVRLCVHLASPLSDVLAAADEDEGGVEAADGLALAPFAAALARFSNS